MLSPLESNHCAKTIGGGYDFPNSAIKRIATSGKFREGTNPFLNSFANVEIVCWSLLPQPFNHQLAVVMDRDGKGR